MTHNPDAIARAAERKRESSRRWIADSQASARERRHEPKTALVTQYPLKRRTAPTIEPRATVKPKTAKRAGQEREYSAKRREYLARHPQCHGCIERKRSPVNAAAQVHHTAGREREMLNDTRFWMAVCQECHSWIHGNPEKAHYRGWLISRSAPELMTAELLGKRGYWPHVQSELEMVNVKEN